MKYLLFFGFLSACTTAHYAVYVPPETVQAASCEGEGMRADPPSLCLEKAQSICANWEVIQLKAEPPFPGAPDWWLLFRCEEKKEKQASR